jgi:uncharacterized protein (DUF983 family)
VRRRAEILPALATALKRRCPRCRQGKFLDRFPNKVLPECPVCRLSYFRESGYYVGGMIVTYGLTAFALIVTYLISLAVPDLGGLSENARFALWTIFAVVLSVVLMPVSYSLWLSLDYWLEPWSSSRPTT